MTLQEIKDELEKVDEILKGMGMPIAKGLSLSVTKSKPPTGYKMRTPFGNCEVLNCQVIDGQYQTVFFATREQIERYIKAQEGVR